MANKNVARNMRKTQNFYKTNTSNQTILMTITQITFRPFKYIIGDKTSHHPQNIKENKTWGHEFETNYKNVNRSL